jgi:hypothetical protein
VLLVRPGTHAQAAQLFRALYRDADAHGMKLEILVASKDVLPPIQIVEELRFLCSDRFSSMILGDRECIRALPLPKNTRLLLIETREYGQRKLLRSVEIESVLSGHEDCYGNPLALAPLSKVISSPKHMLRKIAQLKGVRHAPEEVWLSYVSDQMVLTYTTLARLVDRYRHSAHMLFRSKLGDFDTGTQKAQFPLDALLAEYTEAVAALGTEGVELVRTFFEMSLTMLSV